MAKLKRVILILETSRAFGRDLLYGIARYSRIHGPWTFYREPGGLKSSVPKLKNWNADGIIMRNSGIRSDLTKLKLPTILAPHDPTSIEKIPAIKTHSESIASIAAEHLLSKGLKNFAFCGFDDPIWSNEREQHFKEAIEKFELSVDIYKPSKTTASSSWNSEQTQMKEWVQKLPKPIGIMACNDDRAQQVLEVCKTLEIKVPEQVAVIGVDNDVLLCELSDPPLTSVALNTEQAGYSSAELLDEMMSQNIKIYRDIIVTATHIVQRQSTDLYAVNDEDVVSAIRYIKENSKNKILIKDVVAQTCLGRRTLEMRFKKNFHRSINEEISRVRNELIKQMLIESNLSISEITATFNFIGTEHISRYFKKETGVSLKQFRKMNKNC